MKAVVLPVLLVILFALLVTAAAPLIYGLGWGAGSLVQWLFLPAGAEISGLTIPQIVGIGALIAAFAGNRGGSDDG